MAILILVCGSCPSLSFSGIYDTDSRIVYHVLLHLKRRLNLGDFFRLIEDGGPELKPAANLLQVYAREQNRDLLKDFWFQDDRRTESACLALEEAGTMTVNIDLVIYVDWYAHTSVAV